MIIFKIIQLYLKLSNNIIYLQYYEKDIGDNQGEKIINGNLS